MRKFIWLLFFITFVFPALSQSKPGYVRKQLQPNFYMPAATQKRMNTPEKLAVPQYTAGVAETIKTAGPQKQQIIKKTAQTAGSKHLDYDHGDLSQTPEYQQKYQEYLSDLETIAATGRSPVNQQLEKDLSQMNSNDRIRLDQKFNQSRNPQAKFENVLNQSLSK